MLIFFAVLGDLLALPVLIPDLLAVQEPPQQATVAQVAVLVAISYGVALLLDWLAGRARRVPLWVVPLRAAGLTALCSLVAVLVRDFLVPKIFGQDPGWTMAATVQCVVVGTLAWTWFKSVRAWARNAPHGWEVGGGGAQPSPGEVWLAMVPFRERDEEAKHYCVILRTYGDHAEVLQITSKNKENRDDHIRMRDEGWNWTGTPCWVEVGVPPRTVPFENFLTDRPQGPCPPTTWRQIKQRQAAVGSSRPPGGSRNPSRRPAAPAVPGQSGPARWLSRLTDRRRG
jgi:hypothetical protein